MNYTEVTEARHPQLWLCMKATREDNSLPFEEWGGVCDDNGVSKGIIRVPDTYTSEEIDAIELSLKPLSLAEIETLNTGEHTDACAIREKYGIRIANSFLEEYFENWSVKKGSMQTPNDPPVVDNSKEGWVRAIEHFVSTAGFYAECEVPNGLQGLFVMLDYDEFVNMTNALKAYMNKFNFEFSWDPVKKHFKLPSGAKLSFRCISTMSDYQNFRGHQYGWVCLDRTGRNTAVNEPDIRQLARASSGTDAFYLHGSTTDGYSCNKNTTQISRI